MPPKSKAFLRLAGWMPDQRALEAALIAWMPFLGLQARCQGRMKIGLKADFHAPLERSRPLTARLQSQECIQAIKAALCARGGLTGMGGCPRSTHTIQRRAFKCNASMPRGARYFVPARPKRAQSTTWAVTN